MDVITATIFFETCRHSLATFCFITLKLPIKEIGSPLPTTGNIARPLDIIEFFAKRSTRIIDIVGPWYDKGLSITDIADQTGVKCYTIWKALKNHKKNLSSQDPVPFERWRQGRGKMKARPPFGFCFFQGEVIKDPKEYPTLLLIQSLGKQGANISSIVRHLDGKGIQSRMGMPWSYNAIKATIRRLKTGHYEKLKSCNDSLAKKNKYTGAKNEP